MKFYHYFMDLIYTLCLILTLLHAQADALNITHERGETCISSPKRRGGPNTVNCLIATPYDGSYKVKCNPLKAIPSNLTVTWLKDTKVVPQDDRVKVYESDGSYVLEFNPVVPGDMGNYDCRLVKNVENPSEIAPERIAAIEIRVLPYVKQAHKDFTVVEGHPINLTCTVLSAEPTTVTWTVKTPSTNNEAKNFTSSDDRVILEKINDTTNAMFLIKTANLTLDRGSYNCTASSEVGDSTTGASFTIRLKSKYAALWPLLGIVAEVILLCAIILIYEKKRDKSELEESDTDQGPETKSSPDHGQDGVRYRK